MHCRALGLALALCLGVLARPAAATTSPAALELVREARVHEAEREDDVALRRYMEALSLDPTCGEAYLGLGALRARLGDLREAERVYAAALAHLPTLAGARAGRARVLRELGRVPEARLDLEAYVAQEDDPAALRELAGWYGEDGLPPAQLAVWRRIALVAQRARDPSLAREAQTMVRALQILVGPADPVTAPGRDDAIRRGLARIAKRGG